MALPSPLTHAVLPPEVVRPARQLALPWETTGGPPRRVGPGDLGPGLAPRRVWRSLAPTLQAAVCHAVTRICQEVAHDAAASRR